MKRLVESLSLSLSLTLSPLPPSFLSLCRDLRCGNRGMFSERTLTEAQKTTSDEEVNALETHYNENFLP